MVKGYLTTSATCTWQHFSHVKEDSQVYTLELIRTLVAENILPRSNCFRAYAPESKIQTAQDKISLHKNKWWSKHIWANTNIFIGSNIWRSGQFAQKIRILKQERRICFPSRTKDLTWIHRRHSWKKQYHWFNLKHLRSDFHLTQKIWFHPPVHRILQ